ncbi:MAG: GCN5-related N-acetyltransferase [Sphingomonas bacterium]|nr:GCN5-related N-acetyltransferase [Sphingomonas bacterium]
MGLILVEPGQVATVVTSLEMRKAPAPRPLPASPFRLARWKSPRLEPYRGLFRRVGAPWLWFSRLVMPDEALAALLADERVEIYAIVDRAGIEIGILELDLRIDGECELAFLGLVPELAAKGHGRWLMTQALSLAWRKGVQRVWVHTCTLDHPAALGFYRRHGFVPFASAVETFADPRLAGILPQDAAPHVPIIAAAPSA